MCGDVTLCLRIYTFLFLFHLVSDAHAARAAQSSNILARAVFKEAKHSGCGKSPRPTRGSERKTNAVL